LDALTLLKNPDHRGVFITTALYCIPLASFYPYAPPHLRDLGFERTTAWMSLGQVTEIIAMFSLGALLARWRLKWIFAVGLGFGVIRFAVSSMNTKAGLLAGVALHGCSFALVFTMAQIYLDQRVEPAWRARAQALMTLMNSGFGYLTGYLGTGWWFAECSSLAGTRWPRFWAGLSITVGAVMMYFLIAYQGRARKHGESA
jgi:MFS family permease